MKLGIDLGGSKMRFTLVEKDKVSNITFDYPSNPSSSKNVGENLLNALRSLNVKDFELIGCSMAGGLQEGFKKKIEDVLRKFSHRVFVYPDIIAVYYSFFKDGDGVVVISGTGSSIYGKSSSQGIFYGGLGFALADVGSGYDIGRRYLRKGLSDMQLKKYTKESRIIISYYKENDVNKVIDAVYKENVVKSIADFSVFVLKKDGRNPVIKKASIELAKDTLKLIKMLKFNEVVSIGLSGGVFENSQFFRSTFLSYIEKFVEVNVAHRLMPNEIASICLAEGELSHVL